MDSDKTRAQRAEKQVERLERELELIKSRTKKSGSPVLLHDTDRLNFQLQEQVKDLKHQLQHQLAEHSQLQDRLTTRTNEYEEKLKRMREIFGQASRNIDQYRATIASKDTEIDRLRTDYEACQVQEQTLRSLADTQQVTVDRLNTQLTQEKTWYGSKVKQLENRNRQLEAQLGQTKADYEQYKKRAHVLLTQTDQTSVRLNELQDKIDELQSEKRQYKSEQESRQEHQLLLEHDLTKALDRIRVLEKAHDLARQQFESTKATLEANWSNERQALEQELESMKLTLATHKKTKEEQEQQQQQQEEQQQQQQQEEQQQQQQQENDHLEQLELRLQALETTNESLEQQLREATNEIERSTPPPPPPIKDTPSIPKEDVYASMSSLLSPLSQTLPDERIRLEKQAQRLSQLLHESEEKVLALQHQGRLLKDELRKLDAVEKRQDMNNEYLKNVLIKFLTSDNKQTMVPILSKLLYLDEAETNQLMTNCN